MDIGTSIKRIRQEKSLSQGELAKSCGISQTSLSQIEKGIKRPSSKNLAKICKILEVPEPLIYLYGIEESDIPKRKKELFKMLYPSVEALLKQIIAEPI